MQFRTLPLSGLVAAFAIPALSSAQSAQLVRDINPILAGSASSNPRDFTVVELPTHNDVYFAATTVAEGEELYHLDGATGVILQVDSITTGVPASSAPMDLTAVDGVLVYTTYDSMGDRELFGVTPGSAVPIAYPDPTPTSGVSSNISDLTPLGNGFLAFETSVVGQAERTVARLDTATSTVEVFGALLSNSFDIVASGTNPGTALTWRRTFENAWPFYPGNIFAARVWSVEGIGSTNWIDRCGVPTSLPATDARYEMLGYSEGLAGDFFATGTGAPVPVAQTICGDRALMHWDGRVTTRWYLADQALIDVEYYLAHDGVYVVEESSGSIELRFVTAQGFSTVAVLAGSTLNINDVVPTGSPAAPGRVFMTYFTASTGWEIAAVNPSAGFSSFLDTTPGLSFNTPTDLRPFGTDRILYRRVGALWTSDGTDAGTFEVHSPSSAVGELVVQRDGTSAFFEDDGDLYATDGTVAGTVLLAADISPYDLTYISPTEIIFAAEGDSFGVEPWRSDGTVSGTVRIADIETAGSGTQPSHPTHGAVQFGSSLVFVANDGVHGNEPWISDGSAGGTVMLLDARPGGGSSSPNELTVGPECVFFTASTATNGRELWKTDGVVTQLVKDVGSGVTSSDPTELTMVQNTLFFRAWSAGNGVELWKSDGTNAGTQLVTNVWPGGGSSSPSDLVAWGDRVVFVADDSASGRELCWSDGTSGGTVVLDVLPGSAALDPSDIATWDGKIWFAADDGVHGRELWVSDGTVGGTMMVMDINGGGSSNPAEFVAPTSDDGLWFAANDPARRVFRVNRNGGGYSVAPVTSTPTGGDPVEPRHLISIRNALVVTADDPTFGPTLFRVTPLGAMQRLHPTLDSPSAFYVFDDRLVFFRADDLYGNTDELWVTDATNGGTVPLWNFDPSGVGAPTVLGDAIGQLFVAASDPNYGRELWTFGPYGTVNSLGYSCGSPTELTAKNPTIGTNLELIGTSTAGAAQAVPFFAFWPVLGLPLPGADPCRLYIGGAHQGMTPVPVIGRQFTSSLPIPNDTNLLGLSLMFQAAMVPGTGPFVGMDLTQAIVVTFEAN